MSLGSPIPPYPDKNLGEWARNFTDWFIHRERSANIEPTKSVVVKLQHMKGDEKALDNDGMVMWNPVTQLPVYSKGGAWYYFDNTPM